ncbi:MAG: hypothetical protein WDA75_03225 [Candidatus Latescibacterota bacterium]
MKRIPHPVLAVLTGLLFCLVGLTPTARAQELEVLRRPRNGALQAPAGQGLDMLHGAEPLGKGRFRFGYLNRSQSVTVPEVGAGSAYTGTYAMAYGVTPALETSLVIPFLMDSAGGLNKYGTGDPCLGVKWSRPTRVPGPMFTAYQLLIGLPLGYKGQHGLDKVGGVRPFSSQALDLGLQALLDMHFRRLSLYLNGGYFRSGNAELPSELVYGLGLETGRGNRWVSFNAEYQSRVAFAQQARAAAALKFGVRINAFRGGELEFNREFGFLDHPSGGTFTFGVRLHGYLTGRRRLESRFAMYRPVPPPKRQYRPTHVLRLAIVDFAGYEDLEAGARLVDKLKARLEPHDSIQVVDLKRYEDVPHVGFLKPRDATILAQRLGVDVVVTGQFATYEVDRFSGYHLPFTAKLPEARVNVDLRYRVVELIPGRGDDGVLTALDQVSGQSRLRSPVRLLPADRRDITVGHTADDLQEAQDRALEDLAGKMLASMAARYAWIPPDFLP